MLGMWTAGEERDVTAPLSEVRVVELSSWMASSSAGAVLADLGADVVKVEPLAGDPVRGMSRLPKRAPGEPPIDASFQVDNRGKRSVAIAIDRAEGAELVRRLVAGADVFLSNLLPGRQRRFGLDAESLLALRPRLVHATFTGYGTTGPDAERPGYDVTAFFGRGAITDSMTEPDGVAPQPRPAQGDHAAAMALVAGVLAALRLAERSGEGQVVEASLLGMATWTMATDLAPVLVDGRQPSKRDRHHLITPLANRFRCADDRWIVLNMPEPHWWPKFCRTVDREAWLDDPRFETVKSRFDQMPELIDLLDEVFAAEPLAVWGRTFDEAGLIWGPAATMLDLVDDPQAEAAGLFPEIEVAGERVRTVAAPLKIAGADIAPRGPAPGLAQHTVEVLGDLGLSPAEIEALAADGVIGVADGRVVGIAGAGG
jgi:crotonobetainyl-CoA:carnitine CoA-transferase CaiB-like acyl-CoA transferase